MMLAKLRPQGAEKFAEGDGCEGLVRIAAEGAQSGRRKMPFGNNELDLDPGNRCHEELTFLQGIDRLDPIAQAVRMQTLQQRLPFRMTFDAQRQMVDTRGWRPIADAVPGWQGDAFDEMQHRLLAEVKPMADTAEGRPWPLRQAGHFHEELTQEAAVTRHDGDVIKMHAIPDLYSSPPPSTSTTLPVMKPFCISSR